MQTIETNKENQNPQHFQTIATTDDTADRSSPQPDDSNDTNLKENHDLSSEHTNDSNNNDISTIEEVTSPSTEALDDSPTATNDARPKFSFASDYTPSRHFASTFAGASAPTYSYEPQYPGAPSAFTVLNTDNSSLFSAKPNAIVHPIRRAEEAALPANVLGRDLRITGLPAPGSLSATHPQYGRDVRTFAEELNRKLSYLDSSGGARSDFSGRLRNAYKNAGNQDALNQRPLFITTVPRGVFLPPPKEITLLSPSRKRQLYAYSSHPVVYNNATAPPSSFYQQHAIAQQQHYHVADPYTHNSHKARGASSHAYSYQQHHHPYGGGQVNYSTTMAKDKYRTGPSAGDGAVGEAGEGIVGGAEDGESQIAITSADKELSVAATKLQQHPNGVRGSNAHHPVTSPPLGGISISKQQFRQQLEQSRSKRETPPAEPYKNVMYDKRVVRGTNFGSNPLLGDYDPFDKAAEYRRRQALRKKNVNQKNQRNVLGTPPPVAGRRHEDVQTDKYLEELVFRPPELSVETQTDLFLEKPPTPPYVPAKVGIDVATEIPDGELFHFDAEAQPIIDVLVDSTIELSILEVAHEQEIESIRKKQAELLAQREAELAELRRLEAEEIRLQAEKERRLKQDAIAKSLDEEMQQGVTAAKLLQGHIASILPEILENLEPATEATKKEKLMETLCPWLSAEVAQEVGHIVDSREILTVIIQEIIKQRASTYGGYKEDVEEPKLEPTGEEEQAPGEDLICEAESEEEPSQRCPPAV